MILRLWQTRIDAARGREYDDFAEVHSRPMFERLSGCLGALFLGRGEVRYALSLWRDRASIDGLLQSPIYRETVERFASTGILRDPQEVQTFELRGGTLDVEGLLAALASAGVSIRTLGE